MRNYDDIMDYPHHRSKKHPHMLLSDRAAQFSPFAALTGHDAAIKETARLTDRKIELDEYEMAAIDGKLQKIREAIHLSPEITVTYFQPDVRKEGGEYRTVTDIVKKMDEHTKTIFLVGGVRIAIEDIIELVIN